MSYPSQYTILDLPIHTETSASIRRAIHGAIARDQQLWLITANPELFVHAHRDSTLHEALGTADLLIPDGIGISLAVLIRYRKRIHRITGIDLLSAIAAYVEPEDLFFFGGRAAVVQKAAHGLGVPHYYYGYGHDADAIKHINRSQARVLFVGLGSPKQEYWIAQHRRHLAHVRVIIGVGGAFDVLSGHTHRAPRFLRKIGLEWLWRLASQPQRIPRIFDAIVVFPLLVLFSRRHNQE